MRRYLYLFIYFICVPPVLASGAHHAEGFNFWPLFWHIINFSLLLIILYFLTKEKVKEIFIQRSKDIKRALDEAHREKAEAEEIKKVYEDKIRSLEKEIEELIKEAENAGNREKNRIIEKAEIEKRKIVEQIEVSSKKELEDAKKELKNEISNLSLVYAEDLIRKNIKKGDQTRLLEDYIKSIGT